MQHSNFQTQTPSYQKTENTTLVTIFPPHLNEKQKSSSKTVELLKQWLELGGKISKAFIDLWWCTVSIVTDFSMANCLQISLLVPLKQHLNICLQESNILYYMLDAVHFAKEIVLVIEEEAAPCLYRCILHSCYIFCP